MWAIVEGEVRREEVWKFCGRLQVFELEAIRRYTCKGSDTFFDEFIQWSF